MGRKQLPTLINHSVWYKPAKRGRHTTYEYEPPYKPRLLLVRVCVCVCVCACMYVHAHVCTCFHVRMGLCIQVHMRGCHNKQNSTCYRGVDQLNPFCFSLSRESHWPTLPIISVVLCYKPIFISYFFSSHYLISQLHSIVRQRWSELMFCFGQLRRWSFLQQAPWK